MRHSLLAATLVLALTAGAVYVFVHVRREYWLGRRVERAGWVVCVARLAGGWPDFVVGQHIAAHQRGQAGEHDVSEASGVVELGEAVHQPDRPLQGFQRDVHGRTPPGRRAQCAICV